ncbi:hypothetical protein FisN_7Lh015 [Fistulifera solaris]|uniref:Uncharacterized protein n=1 Tax=Fistulifera solaris TaxID=1519565 RepID=A0A1Z5JCE8_FISSO|nr:hypothetical protein FisN_7Lh015 [Fistulifera solaris]|eukprot:GAX11655.1 hypothetical protein FisN_7Lh015 [Fistulifera solaris]
MPEIEFYNEWMKDLEAKLAVPIIPSSLLDAFKRLEEAQIAKQRLDKEKGVLQIKARQNNAITTHDIAAAQARVEEQTVFVDKALKEVQHEYEAVADEFDSQFPLPASLKNEWMTYILLKSHTPANWAKAPLQEQCLDFLQHDFELQEQILLAGGPLQDATSQALAIYMQLQEIIQDESPPAHAALWDKLALAAALELCVPLPIFGQPDQFVDPIERYRHYENAFLQGDLDPYFEHFSVFELRYVINSDADSASLNWGREALRNFRPQLLYASAPQWRYSEMVKTDVPYKAPDWYKGYQSYDQILQGGGKCGPRAWYGRFICKAFGIPTWGAKQQGHAAMARWTEHGWETNLGGGFRANFWEGRCGLHFQLETQVRNLLGEMDFFRQIVPMTWYAIRSKASKGDRDSIVQMDFQPSGQNIWLSLALMKCQKLVQHASSTSTSMGVSYPRSSSVFRNKIQMLVDAPIMDENAHVDKNSGTIIIPAASPLKRPPNKAWFPKSCLGGMQLLLNGPISLEYEIPSNQENVNLHYKVSLRICVIKRNVDPLQIGWKGQEQRQIDVPNTCGDWQWTQPCGLEWKVSFSRILVLQRMTQQHLIAIKDIRLDALSEDEYRSLVSDT